MSTPSQYKQIEIAYLGIRYITGNLTDVETFITTYASSEPTIQQIAELRGNILELQTDFLVNNKSRFNACQTLIDLLDSFLVGDVSAVFYVADNTGGQSQSYTVVDAILASDSRFGNLYALGTIVNITDANGVVVGDPSPDTYNGNYQVSGYLNAIDSKLGYSEGLLSSYPLSGSADYASLTLHSITINNDHDCGGTDPVRIEGSKNPFDMFFAYMQCNIQLSPHSNSAGSLTSTISFSEDGNANCFQALVDTSVFEAVSKCEYFLLNGVLNEA